MTFKYKSLKHQGFIHSYNIRYYKRDLVPVEEWMTVLPNISQGGCCNILTISSSVKANYQFTKIIQWHGIQCYEALIFAPHFCLKNRTYNSAVSVCYAHSLHVHSSVTVFLKILLIFWTVFPCGCLAASRWPIEGKAHPLFTVTSRFCQQNAR